MGLFPTENKNDVIPIIQKRKVSLNYQTETL